MRVTSKMLYYTMQTVYNISIKHNYACLPTFYMTDGQECVFQY